MTKVTSKDIDNIAFLTTGTAPAFEVTIPREAAYADMDRQKITINLHASASAAITININSLGAKALVDNTGAAITTATADDYFDVIFDVSQDRFIGSAVGVSSSSWPADTDIITFAKAFNVVNWDEVFPHSLGKVPTKIEFHTRSSDPNSGASWLWTPTKEAVVFNYSSATPGAWTNISNSIYGSVSWNSKLWHVLSVTDTDITIRWTGSLWWGAAIYVIWFVS